MGVVLVFLVLIQRGKGGGLAGMLGGAGGSSPFGSRAGDMFTRVTLILAVVWIIFNMVLVGMMQHKPTSSLPEPPPASGTTE
jgi:preprotein translocase subunit SecG